MGDPQELLGLLSERGVTCKNCKGAEKSHIVAQVATPGASIRRPLRTLLPFPPCTNTRRPTSLRVFPGVQVKESIHLPKKAREAPASSNSEKKPDVDDLMASLIGMPGMENIKVPFAPLLSANAVYEPTCVRCIAEFHRVCNVLCSHGEDGRCSAETILTR